MTQLPLWPDQGDAPDPFPFGLPEQTPEEIADDLSYDGPLIDIGDGPWPEQPPRVWVGLSATHFDDTCERAGWNPDRIEHAIAAPQWDRPELKRFLSQFPQGDISPPYWSRFGH